MLQTVFALLVASALLTIAQAQNQEPIYVPFQWSRIPLTATNLGSSGGTTTFALLDGPRSTMGPALVMQSGSVASMLYEAPSTTLSGICNLQTPYAVCTLNVQETGEPLPAVDVSSGATTTKKSSSTSGSGSSGSSNGSRLTKGAEGTIWAMASLAVGFCISLAFLR